MADASLDQQSSKFDEATLLKGHWWAFDCDGDEITIHGSSFSGMERVYINDELVFAERSISICSRHQFVHEDQEYKVHLSLVSLSKGDIECLLIKNGHIVGRKTTGLYNSHKYNSHKLSFTKNLLIPLGLGGIIGMYFLADRRGIFEKIPSVETTPIYAGVLALIAAAGVLYWRRVKAKVSGGKDTRNG